MKTNKKRGKKIANRILERVGRTGGKKKGKKLARRIIKIIRK